MAYLFKPRVDQSLASGEAILRVLDEQFFYQVPVATIEAMHTHDGAQMSC